MKGVSARVLVVLTILSMLLSLVPATALAAPPTPEANPPAETGNDAHLKKISPNLRESAIAGGTKKVRVMVFALPGTDWRGLLDRPLNGKIDFDGLRMTSGWASEANLIKLASLPGVDAVLGTGGAEIPPPPNDGEVQKPKLNRSARPAGAVAAVPPTTGEQAKPNTWNGRDIVGATKAIAAGFDGNGVIVSINDTGLDFAHPDLQGTMARDLNPASPYYGWPLVADEDSIFGYLTTGSTDNTYYADTSATFSHPAGPVTGTHTIFNGVLTHTITFSNTSKSGVYHYGWHPDYSLGYVEGPDDIEVTPMVLLVDENTAGVYDTVYVDLGNGLELTYDFTKARPNRRGSEEVWADLTGDGIADVSGGIIYWIADGINWMPGTEALYDVTGMFPPDNASLVAFFGDYNGQSHGTGVASQIVAQGVINSQFGQGYNVPNFTGVISNSQVVGGVLRGVAPRTKLFPGLYGNYNNWVLAALGYDGIPANGDDAQIITNSWGWINILPGWDYYSRLATFIARRMNPYMTIMGSAGNGGWGYGTMDTHGSPSSIIVVGASTQYGTDDGFSIISDTTQITFDDVIYFSNRGPNGLGQIKPQVTCIGNSGSGAYPLNLSASPLTGFYDGRTAWYEFGGTSQASPMCAGVLAATMQAYKARTGSWPTYLEARNLLMNGADDLFYDPFVQGAGRANADRSTRLAAGLQGARISPSEWNAGDYRGSKYEAFAHIMFPGTSSSQVFSVTNWNTTNPMTVSITSDYLVKVSEVITTFTTQPQSQESAYTFRKPDYLWRIDQMIPADTDLMEINVYSPYAEFSFGNPSDPTSQLARGNNAWYARVYDWTDWDSDGVLWTDNNGSGTVDGGELDEPATNPLSGALDNRISLELNQLNEGNVSGNTNQVRVQKPLQRMTNGLWLGLVHRVRNAAQPQTHLQIKYTFYKHVSWPWLTTDAATLTVPPSSTVNFTATMTLPPTTTLGLYEGAIKVTDTTYTETLTTVIPVAVNVAANSTSFTYSSPNGTDQIFDNGRVFGGYDWRGNGNHAQGDWRVFFTDVPDSTPVSAGSRFMIEASWVYTPTDIDILAYGPTAHYSQIPIPTPIIGPYNLGPTGASPSTVHSTGTGDAYAFRTSSGGAKELITARLDKGLNEIMLHNVLYNGPVTGEPFTLTVGTATVTPSSVAVTTTESYLDVPMTFVSSLDLPSGLQGLAFGLSAPVVYDDQFVAQSANRYYTFTVNAAGLLTVRTAPTGPNYDIDLFLERLTTTGWAQIGSSGGADANEVIQVQLPPNGTYRARVNGYDVPGPANKYRITIDVIQGTDVAVSGLPSGAISAGTTVSFTLHLSNMTWIGRRNGILYMGPTGSPTAFTIPIVVTHPQVRVRFPIIFKDFAPVP